jgi:deoxyribonuclease V
MGAEPSSAAAARLLLPAIAARIETSDRLGAIRVIGGADASALRFDATRAVHAGLVALDAETLAPLAEAGATRIGGLPYIPGLLGFREAPALVAAFQALPVKPDLILVDGHGIAHPRGCGVASHLGVLLDLPTIGVAKSLLVGEVAGLGAAVGARAEIRWQGRVIGMALRTRLRANPIYVSAGHRIGLASAVRWVEAVLRGRRLPEPTRLAHDAATRQRLAALAGPG